LPKPSISTSIRVGFGYDIHRLVPGSRLVLGGVSIPSTVSLKGHSDADVVLHAVCDALLGAASLGDIGKHFPNSKSKYKGISSLKLLEQVAALLESKHYGVVNIDATVILEYPKIGARTRSMEARIARTIGIPARSVSVKATTNELLGTLGRSEGCAAMAIALITSTR